MMDVMRTHDCRCVTTWDDELGHPVYLEACSTHRRQVPDGWMAAKPKSKARKAIQAST